ncbi:MAG: hypothetical protein J6W06_05025 [Bacteroidales bacterium]|nr:hypothetical protein [Bacteroidales bacterium]
MNDFENIECQVLSKKYKLHIEDANFARGFIPQKVLLDSTRNIHSYFVFCKYEDGIFESEYWNKDSFSMALRSMIALQYSDLDRPLFFVFQDSENKYKIIEGNELREAFLENPEINIINYIKENSYYLLDVIIKIKKEL